MYLRTSSIELPFLVLDCFKYLLWYIFLFARFSGHVLLSYISSGCKYLRYVPAIVSYFRALFGCMHWRLLWMHGMGFRLLQYIKVLEIKRARMREREFYIYCILQMNPWDECHWTGWEDKILFQCPLLSRTHHIDRNAEARNNKTSNDPHWSMMMMLT